MREKRKKKSPVSHLKGENSDFQRELKGGYQNSFNSFVFLLRFKKSSTLVAAPNGLVLLCQYLKQEEDISK